MPNRTITRTDQPLGDDLLAIGNDVANRLGLTPANITFSNCSDADAVARLITNPVRVGGWSWDTMLNAEPAQITGSGLPSGVVGVANTNGFPTPEVGRIVKDAIQRRWDALTVDGVETAAYSDGDLVVVKQDRPYSASLNIGDVVRITEARDLGTLRVTDKGCLSPDAPGLWTVSVNHVEPVKDIAAGTYVKTLGQPGYSINIPEGTILKVMFGPDHDGEYLCHTDDDAPRAYRGYYKRNMLLPVDPPVAEQTPDEAAATATAVSETVLAQPEVAGIVAERDRLSERVTQQDQELIALRRWRDRAVADMSLASEVLIEESRRRNWCSEYDDIVDTINSRMNVLAFDVREHDYNVVIDAEVTIDVAGYEFTGSVSVSISVTASDEDDVADQIEGQQVRDAVYDLLPTSVDRGFEITNWTIDQIDEA
jgi:hypothetical protein